ncbi:MAG: plasmid encoded RepA protein [Treponema sp.]|nr:plasmid encoded RepA protein [Treponema sp.]
MKTDTTNTEDKNTADLPATMDEMFVVEKARQERKILSYIPSFFTTASLPFRNVNSPVFVRKGSNGITLKLTAPENVPFGRYGRLLLSLFTTHAVLSKEKDCTVFIEYTKLLDLLNELQLPKSRGKDVKEQLDCFTNASFAFEQKIKELKSGYLFRELYENGDYPKSDVMVTTVSTGNIRFTTGVQYQEIDDGSKSNKVGAFKIILSPEFSSFCQAHAVPIDYTVYKNIDSPAGKDIYAWLIYRNNGMKANEPVFIPKEKLVEQFMPVGEDAHPKQLSTNYNRILDHIREIKTNYYPEVKVSFDQNGSGITLYKSPTPVLKDDTRYALITSDI